MSSQALPSTHKALRLHSTSQPLTVEPIPTPQPCPGSATIRVCSSIIISYSRQVFCGVRKYPLPLPLTPGPSAVGRVAALGPDATSLQVGQLVYTDTLVRARDSPDNMFLLGVHQGFNERTSRLMRDNWRDGTYAEYARLPLENIFPLDEARLLGDPAKGPAGLGYTTEELAFIAALTVPFGGLRDVGLSLGEKILIAPATGQFGGAAVLCALAMGAHVVAMGRDQGKLASIKAQNPSRVETVPITGNVDEERAAIKEMGSIDVYLDISPPAAAKSTHLKAGILALRHGGRVSLMGGITDDVPIPHVDIMHKNKMLKGKWMYDREDIPALVRLIEGGFLPLKTAGGTGVRVAGKYALEQWKEALDCAAEKTAVGEVVVFNA